MERRIILKYYLSSAKFKKIVLKQFNKKKRLNKKKLENELSFYFKQFILNPCLKELISEEKLLIDIEDKKIFYERLKNDEKKQK